MFFLIVLTVIAAVVVFFLLRSGENLRFETTADPHRVVMAAIGIVSAKRRWQMMAQSEYGASFRYHKQPNMLVAIVLLLFLLIPGIVYLVLASKRESLILVIDGSTSGMTVVQMTSNGFRGKFAGRALQRQLALAPGALGVHGARALTSGM